MYNTFANMGIVWKLRGKKDTMEWNVVEIHVVFHCVTVIFDSYTLLDPIGNNKNPFADPLKVGCL